MTYSTSSVSFSLPFCAFLFTLPLPSCQMLIFLLRMLGFFLRIHYPNQLFLYMLVLHLVHISCSFCHLIKVNVSHLYLCHLKTCRNNSSYSWSFKYLHGTYLSNLSKSCVIKTYWMHLRSFQDSRQCISTTTCLGKHLSRVC